MRGGHRGAGWEELILWEGWRRDDHCGGGGGRAGLWGRDERGLVLGEQKSLSSGRDRGGLFLDCSPSLLASGVTRGA